MGAMVMIVTVVMAVVMAVVMLMAVAVVLTVVMAVAVIVGRRLNESLAADDTAGGNDDMPGCAHVLIRRRGMGVRMRVVVAVLVLVLVPMIVPMIVVVAMSLCRVIMPLMRVRVVVAMVVAMVVAVIVVMPMLPAGSLGRGLVMVAGRASWLLRFGHRLCRGIGLNEATLCDSLAGKSFPAANAGGNLSGRIVSPCFPRRSPCCYNKAPRFGQWLRNLE